MELKPLPDLAGYRQLAVVSGDRFQLTRGERDGDETVLLKTLSPEVGSGEARDELRREYELEQRLDHPNIAVAIDLVTDGRRPVLVLADSGGSTLRQVMSRGQLSVRRALEIAIGIATGLAELHSHDIVHRNVNPEGVMVGDGAEVSIIDLSHATLVPRQQAAVIAPGVLRASLAYVSPEQTGRTSRLVDHRTDLYSLGIVLYEMLVGSVPFTAADPLDLFHDHLAVPPRPVIEQRPQVPAIVSSLVDRLLEKDPEDRYRSAVGLVGDLQSIRDRMVRGVDLDDLELQGAEISTRFQLPDQLFGRDEEVAQLEAWLESAARGENTLGFVHGYSGVGKTSLIEELRSSVNRRRGYQAVGKFDQLDRESAYGAVTAAFSDLLRQLLMEDDATIAAWRQELRDTLGDGAGALVEVVPELSALLGDVPSPEPLEAAAARNRFQRLVSLFLATIATTDHPTVIVLDDLQWADAATVDFIEALARGDNRALLVVGAYRDNEVDESHPVHLLRQRLTVSDVGFGDVELAALSHEAMAELVAASLRRTVADAAPLTDLSIRKTGCNPFFARIFLSALFEDGLLQLDPTSGAWSWDMEQVRARKLTDNMVELAMERIVGAGVEAQELISVMAIIGIEGDAELLGEVQESDPYPTLRKLASLDLVLLTEGNDVVRWQFAHDRIQEAASSRLDDEGALGWHRRIGAALERRWHDGHAGTTIFSVLRHRNTVAAQKGSQDRPLAEMNLEGGAAAMRATAYDAAQRYFTMGIELLGPSQWDTDSDTAYELHLGAADAARLALRFDEMHQWLDVIDRSTTDTEQRVKAVVLRLLYLTYAVKSVETVDVARAELAKLGWKLAADPSLAAVIAGLTRTRMAVSRHSIEDLEQLPVMTDITAQAIVRLLNQSVASAYWSNPKVMALMIQKAVQLSVRYGNDPASALFWGSYGMVLAGIVGKPEQGIAYADLAVRLADRFGARAQPGGVRFTRDALVAPATTPLREIEPSLERSYTIGLEYGEIGFAMAAYFFLSLHRLVSGAPLDTLERQLDGAVSLMRQHAAVRNLDQALALRQFVHDMQLGPASGGSFTGPHLDGDSHTDSTDKMTIAWTHTFRAMSRFHFGDAVGAYDDIVAAGPYLDAMLGQALVPVHHLYGVLAAARGRHHGRCRGAASCTEASQEPGLVGEAQSG